ncbi:MAG: 30S ribosomal protein S6 [bacterium]|nr:30S ribosomal protein S6 [bacterium]
MKQNYELTYLISPEVPEEKAQEISRNIDNLIQERQGLVFESLLPQKMNLAYLIKKQPAAWFQLTNFSLDTFSLQELEKKLKDESQILRYLILVKLPVKAPSRPRRSLKRAKEKEAKPYDQKVELEEIEKKLEEILNKDENELK